MVLAFLIGGGSSVLVSNNKSGTYAGEIAGRRVSVKEFDDMSKILSLFQDQRLAVQGGQEDQVWLYLSLKREAEKQRIGATDEEVKKQILQLFQTEDMNPAAYENWVRNVLRESPHNFEEMMRSLIRIQKLITSKLTELQPKVTQADIVQAFLDETSTIEAEVRMYENISEAKKDYETLKNPEDWEKAKQAAADKFQATGALSLYTLMEMWKVPRNDAYAMLTKAAGTITGPVPFAEGAAIMKILNTKAAKPEEMDEAKKADYEKRAIDQKKLQRFRDWIKELLLKSNIKKYS
jgi:hypothetical protein